MSFTQPSSSVNFWKSGNEKILKTDILHTFMYKKAPPSQKLTKMHYNKAMEHY